MAFKMRPKSPLMKKLVGKQHRLPEHLKAKIEASPVKKKVADNKEVSDKELLANVEKEGIATDSGNKEKVAEVKKAYTRQAGREVGGMSRKEARQEVKADRKDARAERKAYNENVKRNKGGAFAGEGENKQAGKNIPGLLSSKKKKKSYLTAKRYKGFDKYLADNTKVKEAGKSALNKKGCKSKKY